MTESWKNVLGVLEGPRKVLEFFMSNRVGIIPTVIIPATECLPFEL